MKVEDSPISYQKFIKKRDKMRILDDNEINSLKKCNTNIESVISFLEDNNVEISKFSIWTVLSRRVKEEQLDYQSLNQVYNDLKHIKISEVVLKGWEKDGGWFRDKG